jgi:tetrapyrrole methylase family protein/MazG family protein
MNDRRAERDAPLKSDPAKIEEGLRALVELIARLRSPEGCPWDRAQKREDIGRYLIEEAYEVLEALESPLPEALQEELGDLLFHILFLAEMARESGDFDLEGVLEAIRAKMIRRHPHVFGDTRINGVDDVRRNWEEIKKDEGKVERGGSLMAGLPRSLATLARVQRVTGRASEQGFDWPDTAGVIEKLEEEIAEFRGALKAGDAGRMAEEAGDILFTAVNLCRFAGADAEASLRAALQRFTDRFSHMEKALAGQGKRPVDASPEELDRLWNEAKKKGSSPKR